MRLFCRIYKEDCTKDWCRKTKRCGTGGFPPFRLPKENKECREFLGDYYDSKIKFLKKKLKTCKEDIKEEIKKTELEKSKAK